MITNSKAHTQEFKEGVVRYVLDHPQESIVSMAKKFGIADSTIHAWRKQYQNQKGSIPIRGSGNFASDEAKENARLKKELKDTQDALVSLSLIERLNHGI